MSRPLVIPIVAMPVTQYEDSEPTGRAWRPTEMVRVCLVIASGALLLSSCTSDNPGVSDDRLSGDAASQSPQITETAQVKLDVGHCWIENLKFADEVWGLKTGDQFGTGGLGPEGFKGRGTIVLRSEAQAHYVDVSGAKLTFIPAHSPKVFDTREFGCA